MFGDDERRTVVENYTMYDEIDDPEDVLEDIAELVEEEDEDDTEANKVKNELKEKEQLIKDRLNSTNSKIESLCKSLNNE